jgi:hypothetical protein
MLNTYIYHSLPTTCFGVCYTIFREDIALFAQELYSVQYWYIDYAYFLTPWSRVLLEKLTGSAASQEIPRIIGT